MIILNHPRAFKAWLQGEVLDVRLQGVDALRGAADAGAHLVHAVHGPHHIPGERHRGEGIERRRRRSRHSAYLELLHEMAYGARLVGRGLHVCGNEGAVLVLRGLGLRGAVLHDAQRGLDGQDAVRDGRLVHARVVQGLIDLARLLLEDALGVVKVRLGFEQGVAHLVELTLRVFAAQTRVLEPERGRESRRPAPS